MQFTLNSIQVQSTRDFFNEYPPVQCSKNIQELKNLVSDHNLDLIRELKELFTSEIHQTNDQGLFISINGSLLNLSALNTVVDVNGGPDTFLVDLEEVIDHMVLHLVAENIGTFKMLYCFIDRFYGLISDLYRNYNVD